jgi:hypothetical protein
MRLKTANAGLLTHNEDIRTCMKPHTNRPVAEDEQQQLPDMDR